MKNFSPVTAITLKHKLVLLCFLVIAYIRPVCAQLAVYPLRTAHSTNNNTPQGDAQASLTNPNVIAQTLVGGGSMIAVGGAYNGQGYRVKTNSIVWPTTPTDGFGFDIPIRPSAVAPGYDMHITGISVRDTLQDFDVSASLLYIEPYYQVDGAGPWRRLNGAATVSVASNMSASGLNFGAINETFYSGHTYVIRFYVYASPGADKNDNVRLRYLTFSGSLSSPPAVAPTVSTGSPAATGLYTADVTGAYQVGAGFHTVYQAGFVWGTAPNPTYPASSNNTISTPGTMSATLTGLTAQTTYHVRSYIITQFGTFYGGDSTFTTFPRTAPVVTTNTPATSVLSNKAFGGGVIVDSGGLSITAKGMVWNFAGGATITNNIGKITFNGSGDSFSDFMKQLAPSTSYCYRAFATNAIGTSYGADVCFTTTAAEPVLTAIPGTIDFGPNFYGENAVIVSYILTGANLTPAAGNITINIPTNAGFEIASAAGGPWGNTVSVSYSGATINRKPIFVRFLTNVYGAFNTQVTMTGGGVTAANADTVKLIGTIEASPDDITNRGNDFWLGFGYQESMRRKTSDASVTKMNVYITAGDQPATVVVEIPGVPSFTPQTFTIPANSVRIVSGFPSGEDVSPNNNTNSLTDARLFFTGITNRGIHVYSTNGAPVSVWQHIYADNNSAGGSMVFPTNTWNSSYTVQAYAGGTNNQYPCNSFFYVIADADGTEIEFTPSNDILDNIPGNLFSISNATPAANIKYVRGQTYRVTINRGQVFTAMGAINGNPSSGGASLDLSGTTIRTTSCDKKIAVFCGNGRVITKVPSCTPTDGSDNLIQQMFPTVAWGTRYLTVPTKGMEYNLFRIYIKDPTTIVTVNGTALTAPPANGLYYEVEGNDPKLISSDKPINVTQFILAGSCKNASFGNSANGDPEMIILSPIEQAVTKTVVYSAKLQKSGATPDATGSSGNASFINVILKAEGLATFTIDGIGVSSTTNVDTASSSFVSPFNPALCLLANAFKPHPRDPGYIYAKFRVRSNMVHVLSSDYPFNAIAYGLGDGESYGYNAGTSIKNLSSYKISVNPEGTDSSSTVIRTCVNLPITIKLAYPYNPSLVDSIVWQPNDARVSPNNSVTGPVTAGVAVVDDTIIVDGRTFYVYKAPLPYTFSASGLYRLKVTAFGTFASDCPGEDQQTMLVNVGQDILNLAANPSCGNATVPFTADTIPMVGTHILNWQWDFGDNTSINTGTLSPQNHTYPAGPTAFTVKLTTKNTIGCSTTDSLTIDFGGGLESKFTSSKDSVCMNVPVTFTDASAGTGTSGAVNSWEWDFGNGNTSTLQTPPPQSYTTHGIKTITLTVRTAIGCVKTFRDTVVVEATPVAAINSSPAVVCLGDNAAYQDASTIAIGNITGWTWTFDEGAPLTSNLQNPRHLWLTPGNHTATLSVSSSGGCVSTNTATHSIRVNRLPQAGFQYDMNCTTRTITLTDTSNAYGETITGWAWDFGDGNTSSSPNPTHVYATSGTYTVTLSVVTANGCRSAAPQSVTVTIAASPVADFTLPGNTCLPSASPVFQNNTSISDGTISQVTYVWNFGDGTGDLLAPSLIPASPTHVFSATGNYTVTLTAISNNGCTHSVTQSYAAIYSKPVAVITAPAGVCIGNASSFSASSSTAPGSTVTGWVWTFGDGTGTSTSRDTNYTYQITGPKTVSLTVTSAAGCVSDMASTSFSVNQSPQAAFTYSATRCKDSAIVFTDASITSGAAITEWQWDFGGDGSLTQTTAGPATHVFTNASSYNVSLIVKDANGCLDGSPYVLPVVINPNPTMGFSVSDICVGTGLANFTHNVSLPSGQIHTWNWNFGVAGAAPGTTANPSFTYTTGGAYTVSLQAISDSGCANTISKTVEAFTAPTVAFDINNPTSLCSNVPVGIINRSAVAGYGSIDKIEIYWDAAGAPAQQQTFNAPAANGTYTHEYPVFGAPATKLYQVMIRAFNGPGCTTDITQNLAVLAAPNVQFATPAPVCQEAAAFVLTGASDVFGLPGTGLYTGDGISNGTFTPLLAGAGTHPIRYTFTTTNGCVDFEEKNIVVHPTPTISFGNQSTINMLEGDVLKLNPTITNGATYLWSPATYLNNAGIASPTAMPLDDIIYNLQVSSAAGCVKSQTIFVKVVRKYIVPNTFTPNNDGNHDRFEIENLFLYPDVRVRIFSRSGQMVFESYGYSTPWDGKFKGQDCPFGTYYYVIETGGGRAPKTGYVTIIR